MSSTEAFLAFGTVMLVVALLAVAIDWFGKPMRNRRFVPKIYRYPDERGPRRVHDRPASPSAPPPRPGPGPLAPFETSAAPIPARTAAPPIPAIEPLLVESHDSPYPDGPGGLGGKVAVRDEVDLETPDVTDPGRLPPDEIPSDATQSVPIVDGASTPAARGRGWSPGDSVYNLTAGGSEPVASTIRNRYWRNVAASPGASLFGAENVRRMAEGKAPQRHNPRTGKTETMRLGSVDYLANQGRTPVPHWPDSSVDPYC
jgi:hypothetical protein